MPHPLKDVLVTGSSGQVGSYLVEALRAAGLSVTGLDLVASPWTDVVGDVRQTESGASANVVHCAALVSVQASIRSPREDAEQNVIGTLAALEWARKSDAARFVFFSSAAVYGRPMNIPIAESAPLRPLSPYGLSKEIGERYVRMYGELYGLPWVILRPFNIFSARSDPKNPYAGVVTAFAAATRAGAPLRIFGTGEQTRDFIHVDDVVLTAVTALRDDRFVSKTINVGTGKPTSIKELARMFRDCSGTRSPIIFEPGAPGDIPESVADITLLRSLGIHPQTDIRRHLEDLLKRG